MRALTWQGPRDVRVETVPDPTIEEPTDAIIRITSSGLCGSDLHLYEVMAPFMREGDILGHEPMGVVEAVGDAVTTLRPGDRVVVLFNIACGHCFMCVQGPKPSARRRRSETGMGGRLFGYSSLRGRSPARRRSTPCPARRLRPDQSPERPADDRFVYLPTCYTAWQAVRYAASRQAAACRVAGTHRRHVLPGRPAPGAGQVRRRRGPRTAVPGCAARGHHLPLRRRHGRRDPGPDRRARPTPS